MKTIVSCRLEKHVRFSFIEQLEKVSAHGQGKVHFTLIELLVVIAIIAITTNNCITAN